MGCSAWTSEKQRQFMSLRPAKPPVWVVWWYARLSGFLGCYVESFHFSAARASISILVLPAALKCRHQERGFHAAFPRFHYCVVVFFSCSWLSSWLHDLRATEPGIAFISSTANRTAAFLSYPSSLPYCLGHEIRLTLTDSFCSFVLPKLIIIIIKGK